MYGAVVAIDYTQYLIDSTMKLPGSLFLFTVVDNFTVLTSSPLRLLFSMLLCQFLPSFLDLAQIRVANICNVIKKLSEGNARCQTKPFKTRPYTLLIYLEIFFWSSTLRWSLFIIFYYRFSYNMINMSYSSKQNWKNLIILCVYIF